MSNGRSFRRKAKGVSKRKLRPVAGGIMTRQQLNDLVEPIKEMVADAGEASGVETDGEPDAEPD